jgi:hypothetical protein
MKAKRERRGEARLHSFFTSALDGGRMGPRGGLDVLEEKNFFPLPGFELRTIQPVA